MSDTASVAVDSPSSGGNTAAPLTFEQAFAADTSPASAPASETPASAQPAVSAESETAVPSQPAGEDDRSPFIPRSRFDEVNSKLKDLKEWRESRQWAEQVDQSTFTQMAQWFLRAQTDPVGFGRQFWSELAANPEHAQALRSEAARLLGMRQQQGPSPTPEAAEPTPDVEITDGNGNVVGRTYSAEALAKRDAFREAQLLQKMQQQFEPHISTLKGIEQERQTLAQKAQADAFGSEFVKELSALPLFDAHKAEIGKALAQVRLESDSPDAVRAAAYRAYHQIVGPKLGNNSQQAVLADLQRKAAASTSVNPSSAKATTPVRPKSFHDLAPDAWG